MRRTTVDHQEPLLCELVGMLRDLTGESTGWAATIQLDSRLEEDLWLDSVELAALDTMIRERFGDHVDLAAHIAGLEIAQIVELRVRDLIALIRGEQGDT